MNAAPVPVTFYWRPTTDAARAHEIHARALQKTPAGMLRPDPLAHFERHTGEHGQILGCFLDTGEMVAYGILGLDSGTHTRLARQLGTDPASFAILDGAAGLAAWRGFGLHHAGIAERIAHAQELGRSQIGVTVAPEDIRNLRGLLRAGLVVRGVDIVHGTLLHLLLFKNTLLAAPAWRHVADVAMADHAGHRAALASSLAGYACHHNAEGDWVLAYGLPDHD